MNKLAITFAFAAALGATFAGSGDAEAGPMKRAHVDTSHHTSFDPAVHGFKFSNTFVNNPVFDVRTSGLCGGMVYSALDYYSAHMTVPQQDYEPSEGTPLRSYIYGRQVNSLERNLDKWAELKVNPF